ncbi:MAG: CpsD/CapB family tyrosine-protein kinase [Cellvibrionaceae bacterium]
MERIQEALNKARKERDQHIGNHNLPRNPEDKTIFNKIDPASKKSSINIEYSTSLQIHFSDEELKSKNIVAGFAHDPKSEPYRQLRTQVLQKMRAQKYRSLAITSPRERNGKTLTSLNLAISLSQDVNQTVILVDLDLKNPSIAKTLGINNVEFGIIDYLNGNASLEQILINPGFNRLVILPGLPQGPYSSEVLASPEMKTIHNELLDRYEDRIIIYDLPALLNSDDALVFTPFVDATLLVVEDGGSSKNELERSLDLLKNSHLLGTVINNIR